MHKRAHRAIICGTAAAGLTMLLVAPALSQQPRGQQQAQQQQMYTCAAIHKRCVSRSTGREVSMCDGYYSEAQKSGVWPAFGQYPAVACRR